MARPIDAGVLQDNLTDIYGDKNRLVYLKDVLDLIDEQPTLTPPNEPLTLEQLREMGGEPVFVISKDKGKFWALVNMNSVYVDAKKCFFFDDHTEYGKSWLAYRRPTEGET